MRRKIVVTSFIMLFSAVGFYHALAEPTSLAANEGSPGDESRLAIDIAEAFLPKAGVSPSDLKLIEVKNLLVSGPDCCNPHVWRLTFLKWRHIDERGLRGKGGQLYVEVNVRTREAKVRGWGE